jgi:hypothetical protein
MVGALVLAWLLSAGAQPDAVERAVALNLTVPTLAGEAALDSLLAGEQALPIARRVGLWARRYLDWGRAEYRFGLAEGGYATRGLLVPGTRQDCISLLYRTTELARAHDARHAVALALSVRFAGAAPESVVAADGTVDYERPEHLDFSLDMIRSGHWGHDVTATFAGAVLDTIGSARVAPRSFRFVPETALVPADLQEGDLAWLVLDAVDPRAFALRRDHGLVIGHVGVVVLDDGRPWLVHAASRPLPTWYERTGIVRVPLDEYLLRVERYAGVVVTRFLTDR